ncbi:hypothetical protein EYZ11_013242 [Aspergillus tanneri]|uniref:Retroviral polymerase SH3-like domain-containing protein n=1 Tax=Aspergillus tanneri TaxID=1220188 RepID=A0A4S3J3L0_9EURO|nr:hypothetical protein EYZ11_013242 [Aspergillus tanneri]
MYLFGCRAYVRDQDLAKTQKIAPRAFIGYLVGYKASNIWYIWRPKQRKVIEARDINFDESCLYNPTEPLLDNLIQETAPEPPAQVLDVPKLSELVPKRVSFDILDDIQDSPNLTKEEKLREKPSGNETIQQPTPDLTPDPTPDPDERQMPGRFEYYSEQEDIETEPDSPS